MQRSVHMKWAGLGQGRSQCPGLRVNINKHFVPVLHLSCPIHPQWDEQKVPLCVCKRCFSQELLLSTPGVPRPPQCWQTDLHRKFSNINMLCTYKCKIFCIKVFFLPVHIQLVVDYLSNGLSIRCWSRQSAINLVMEGGELVHHTIHHSLPGGNNNKTKIKVQDNTWVERSRFVFYKIVAGKISSRPSSGLSLTLQKL